MSKHPSNNVKSRLLRRGLAGILSLALILSLMPSAIFTAHAASWADPYVNTLVEWGVMRGDVGGNLAPDRSITRAEFVTMMNRAYGYTKLGGHPFADVSSRDWYNEDIDIAYNIGYFQGTAPTLASPTAPLTREQAAVLLSRNMMLQPTVGETLGFSDSRQLSDWSRGLVGAAAADGIISGYDDGSFQPFRNITRGEVAAMLVRAIGTPIQTPGDHALGNVYGNVTVNTSGVKLRDGVIVGNLYLTGGIDLGEVLLENVTVLGEIIVSGGGESNSSESSIIMRNVVADNLVVDSIGDQFVTIRAEGNTDIPTAVVRTNAYVDDSSLPGYGLSFITLDGESGALFQLAGNIKEVLNKTPGSDLQVVQGMANKVTVDEYATGSSVLVDGDAQVGNLNLDTATTVTGTGDISHLNVGAAGSTVEQLPDNIEIRPGIDADINGGTMDSTQAAESSADPKLLAGYPAVKNIAPTTATLVFKTNKTGTIYWAVSAVADGSVSEADLLEPPAYGGNILVSGNIKADAANKEFTAAVSKLTSGGSYYVTAMLVDGRGEHSPIKVTSFSTPDDTVPAFAKGYPVMSKITCDEAQVTVMTTKSCLLYYALLPEGAAAPSTAELKSAAIPGNLGYGSMSVTKNVTIPFPVNNTPLDEKTNYVLYLWLTDHDGAKSSAVIPLRFTTPDETPPNVTNINQTGETASSIKVEYTTDEPAYLVWAIVTEAEHMSKRFLQWDDETFDPNSDERSTLKFNEEAALMAAKIKMQSGTGALQAGEQRTSPLNISNLLTQNTHTSSYVLYYMANDHATTTGNLSTQIKALRVYTVDEIDPKAKLVFTNKDQSEVEKEPDADADVRIVFSENVKGGSVKGQNIFLNAYNDVKRYAEAIDRGTTEEERNEAQQNYLNAKATLGTLLSSYITLYRGTPPSGTKVYSKNAQNETPAEGESWVDWRNAVVTMQDDGTVEVRLPCVTNDDGVATAESALNLDSGASYYFHLTGITDVSVSNNPLEPYPDPCYLEFTTAFAKVNLEESDTWQIDTAPADTSNGKNDPKRADFSFTAKPTTVEKVGDETFWDMLIWSDTSITFTLYERDLDQNGNPSGAWKQINQTPASITVSSSDGYSYISLRRVVAGNYDTTMPPYEPLNQLGNREYAIHIDSLGGSGNTDYTAWNAPLNIRISYLAGTQNRLFTYVRSGTQTNYETALSNGLSSIEQKSPFILNKPFEVLQPPVILDGFPTISVTDTSAKINLALDKAGQVYYLVLPMTQMYSNNVLIDNTNTILSEDVVLTIDRFNMRYIPTIKDGGGQAYPKDVPLMIGGGADDSEDGLAVSQPDQDTVINLGLANSFPNSFEPATAARPREEITIDLTDQLAANTVYYVFLVTRSESAIYSDDPLCYRFTTSEPIRPIINVTSGGGTTVNIDVDKTTDLTYILAPNGDEGPLFLELFTGWANDDWYGNNTTGWDRPAAGIIGTWTYNKEYSFTYTQNNGDVSKMTVVDAMATPCYKGTAINKNNYVGSVFDIFATASATDTFQGAIAGANIADNNIVAKGDKTCNVPPASNSETFTELKPGYYTFLCVGKSAQGSGYAFRAYYSIRVQSTSHPTVVASVNRADPWGRENITGTVTLLFSDPLFFAKINDAGTRQETQKLDTGKGGTHDDQVCLGDIANTTDSKIVVKTDSGHDKTGPNIVTLDFTKLVPESTYYCIFNKGLCDTNGQGSNDQLRVTLYVKATEKDTTGITNPTPDDRFDYSIEVTISPEWDGAAQSSR